MGECFQWKAHGQCSKGDSCSFSHDRDEKDDRHLPHQIGRPELTKWEETPPKHQATERKALQTQGAKFRLVTQIARTRHVNFGTLSCLNCLRPDANMEEHVSSDMLRLRRSPAKSQRKLVRKDQFLLKGSTHLGSVSQDSYQRKSILREEEDWDQNTPSNSPR